MDIIEIRVNLFADDMDVMPKAIQDFYKLCDTLAIDFVPEEGNSFVLNYVIDSEYIYRGDLYLPEQQKIKYTEQRAYKPMLIAVSVESDFTLAVNVSDLNLSDEDIIKTFSRVQREYEYMWQKLNEREPA